MRRSEYPDPQFQRDDYVCLNGRWDFEIDNDYTGMERKLLYSVLQSNIEVPFCPESKLSGIEYKNDILCCWYKRQFELTEQQLAQRIVIRFGAVDYEANVFINGKFVGKHSGGYTPFAFDISEFSTVGKNEITVLVFDNVKDSKPRGKQTDKGYSFGCFYTKTTGIWQSVGLEFTPKKYIEKAYFFPNIKDCTVEIQAFTTGEGELKAEIFYDGKLVGSASINVVRKKRFTVKLSEKHLWEIGNGRLYDVKLTFGEDRVKSYFGLREVRYDGMKFLINGKSVFQRLVLDQGYYPDGIYTAKTTDYFISDIQNAMKAGFNGARLHQKVFEPQFLYECDKAGFIVWGEYGDWGTAHGSALNAGAFISEWGEAVSRDFNHPCIVTWCPMNETWEEFRDPQKIRDPVFLETVYSYTKMLDSTRPCVDASGGYHTFSTDLFDFHAYCDNKKLTEILSQLEEANILTLGFCANNDENYHYIKGSPMFCSEYGGIAYDETKTIHNGHNNYSEAWGYTKSANAQDFLSEFCLLTKSLLKCKMLSGFCYTQLYDVEQESNGLYTYDRKEKFSDEDIARIAECVSRPAEIENQDRDNEVLQY